MSIWECLAFGKRALGDRGEAESLLQLALGGLRLSDVLMDLNKTVDDAAYERYKDLLERRCFGEPLQYIVGAAEFMGLSFHVDKRALIPRSDTEVEVRAALDIIGEKNYKSGLEIGCGGGCICVTIAKIARIYMTAVDICADALALARENAAQNGVDDIITFVQSDMFAAISGTYDFLISNPPYIKTSDLAALPDLAREPRIALEGGADGLDFYRSIAATGASCINTGGALILEVGCDQAADIAGILKENGYNDIEVYKDIAGRDRAITCFV